jgi:hypothetical protein
VSESGWKPFTPTYTGGTYKRRTFWQWLTRKPRTFVPSPFQPVGKYRREGKTVHYKVKFVSQEQPDGN